jgi:glycosyltransferase involved in cell wall biosynthesis
VNEVILTVGICTKNSEATLRNTLGSVAYQDFPLGSIEIIIVDGVSTDKTLKFANDFLQETKIKGRIFYDKGAGLGAARQIVLDNAQGDFILWLDSDVVIVYDFIKQQLSLLRKRPTAGLIRGRCYFTESKNFVADVQNLFFLFD